MRQPSPMNANENIRVLSDLGKEHRCKKTLAGRIFLKKCAFWESISVTGQRQGFQGTIPNYWRVSYYQIRYRITQELFCYRRVGMKKGLFGPNRLSKVKGFRPETSLGIGFFLFNF